MDLNLNIECVTSHKDALGEAPVWCSKTKRLFWIDVRKPCVQSIDPVTKSHKVFPLPGPSVGSAGMSERGGMVVALRDGLYRLNTETGATKILVTLEAGKGNRLNDGKCDRRGRYWVGTMHDTIREPRGSFYRIDADLKVEFCFSDIVCPNSVAISPDDRTFYFCDTFQRAIWAFDFDIEAGRLSNRRIFVDLTKQPGMPDGSTVDAEGFLWSAEYRGSRVVRYTPDGRVDRVLDLPCTNVTSCAFGGENLDVLYITTGSEKLTPEESAAQPYAGMLFAADVGARGLPEPAFKG